MDFKKELKNGSNSHKRDKEHLEQNRVLNELKFNMSIPKNGKVSLSSAGGIATYADSNPTPTMDEDNRNGWLFKKTVAGSDKFNYYFYSQGNNALTLGDLTNMNAIISVDKYDNSASVPFLVVYTKMTGSGDAGSWYKSRVSYSLDNTVNLVVGELCEVYSGNKPSYKGFRQLELKTVINTGSVSNTEEIYTMSIQSDSASGIDTKILVQSVGFDAKDISRNIELSS